MFKIPIKNLTLLDFETLRQKEGLHVVDPDHFLQAIEDPLDCAAMAYWWGIFEDPKPTLNDFLGTLTGADLIPMRRAVIAAYRAFCPQEMLREASKRAIKALFEK